MGENPKVSGMDHGKEIEEKKMMKERESERERERGGGGGGGGQVDKIKSEAKSNLKFIKRSCSEQYNSAGDISNNY